jgi:hypothetical protein
MEHWVPLHAVEVLAPSQPTGVAADNASATGEPDAFIHDITRPAPAALMKTPVKKGTTFHPEGATVVWCSGRLAMKAQDKGSKNSEELAQEVLCKKLEGAADQPDKSSKARNRLIRLFDAPLPAEAMAAFEELLKVISLDGNRAVELQKELPSPQWLDAMPQ